MTVQGAPFVLSVKAPDFTELCDVDGSAKAVVAFVIRLTDNSTHRMTYCGHHWDHRPIELETRVIGHHDLREHGIFDMKPTAS